MVRRVQSSAKGVLPEKPPLRGEKQARAIASLDGEEGGKGGEGSEVFSLRLCVHEDRGLFFCG